MNDLFSLHHALSQAMNRDPVLCLAHLVSWLDPFWQTDDDLDFPHDEHDTLMIALHILRRTFPEIYFDTLQALRQGARYAQLDTLICDAVQAHGIPLDSLEWMPFGVPLPAYGVELDDPEFYTQYSDALPLLECFGITSDDISITEAMYTQAETIANDLSSRPETHWQQIAWSIRWLFGMSGNSSVLCGIKNTKSSETFGLEDAYIIGRLIADDLENHSDNRYQQVSWLLKWLFSSTNNSCVDWDEETMYSVEPLSWEPQDVAFAVEIIAEAESIMADAMSGLQWLIQTPQILLALWQNVTRVQLALAKQAKKTPRFELTWPDPTALPPLTLPEYLSTESS